MTPPNKPLAERLREAAQEIASEGHNGWGNLMIEAADAIDASQRVILNAALARENVPDCTDVRFNAE